MSEPLNRLLAIMARLRDPHSGCEWDLAQTYATIAPYTLEEAYEVADAIERNEQHAALDAIVSEWTSTLPLERIEVAEPVPIAE